MPRTALITGASAGLGHDYAKLFAADKCDLVLVARRKDRLDALAKELIAAHGISVQVIPADLTDAKVRARMVKELTERKVEIEFLVNNAGYGDNGAFVGSDVSKQLGMVDLNISALVELTHAFLPAMVSRGHGRILNIGSTAGFQPGPYMAVYYASKAFVNSFTEALGYELKGTGVTATVSCPGATHTEFAQVAGSSKSNLFLKGGAMSSEQVAKEGYRAMLAGKSMAVHGLKNKIATASVRIGPRALVRSVAATLNRPAEP
ncbi:MAG: SDR family NAD(P)-dependent oxidoreductase [Myxococcaceae bacterium]